MRRDDKNSYLFSLGRNAMFAAIKALSLKEGDEVLTPAFDCDGSLQPFIAAGLKLNFYRSDPYTFRADIEDMKNRITSSTKLIHVINHFGMPQDWAGLSELRKGSGLPILEDNAYSLFSSIGGKEFGSFGDFSIFSLRKNLPMPDGGMLRINNPEFSFAQAGNLGPFVYGCDMPALAKIIKDAMGFCKIPGSLSKRLRNVVPGIVAPVPLYSKEGHGYPDHPQRDKIGSEFSSDYLKPISRLSKIILGRYAEKDITAICEGKRRFYRLLAGSVKGIEGMQVLWPDIPEGIVPFSLSVLVDRNRDELLMKLGEKYYVMSWPILSKQVIDRLSEFPEVELLGRKLLQFNLPSDKVTRPGFERYIGSLIRDLRP